MFSVNSDPLIIVTVIFCSRHEMIDNFYRTISPALITRFKEREENVKSDIFHAYIALLRQTKPATGIAAPDPASMEAEEGPVSLLQAQVRISCVRAICHGV